MQPVTSRIGRQAHERCPICGAWLRCREAGINKTCHRWICRKAYQDQQQAIRQQQCERYLLDYQRRFDLALSAREAQAEAHGVDSPEAFLPVILPSNPRRLVPLSSRHRYRFAKKLLRVIEEALRESSSDSTSADGEDAEPTSTLPVLGTACAVCRGRCCLRGRTHAFLHASTIRTQLRKQSGATARDILSAYCRHLAHVTYENSCVFHGPTGCQLPRFMRSATCRCFVCGGYIEVRNLIERQGSAHVFYAAMDESGVVRTAFAKHPREQ
jgi:hypothetical protein